MEVYNLFADFDYPRIGRIDSDSGNRLPAMNSQSYVLIARLLSFAVSAIRLARVIQIVWFYLIRRQLTGI